MKLPTYRLIPRGVRAVRNVLWSQSDADTKYKKPCASSLLLPPWYTNCKPLQIKTRNRTSERRDSPIINSKKPIWHEKPWRILTGYTRGSQCPLLPNTKQQLMIEILSSCSWTKALTWLLHGSSKLRALVPNVRRRLIAAHTIHFL